MWVAFMNRFEFPHFGILEIDEEHDKIATLITAMHDGIVSDTTDECLRDIYGEHFSFLRINFQDEEHLMLADGYVDFSHHRESHLRILRIALELGELLSKKSMPAVQEKLV